MNFVWGLLNDLSFIMILSFISLNVPGIVQNIQSTFLTFIYMDLLQTDRWLPQLFYSEDELASDEPLNAYFDLNGLSSRSVIRNLGSTFVFLLIFLFLQFVGIILKCSVECLSW